MVATTCATAGDGIWFSPNGVDWRFVGGEPYCGDAVYSDTLGFVLDNCAPWSLYRLPHDGSTLEPWQPGSNKRVLAASDDELIALYEGIGYADELWIYRQPGND